MFEKSYRPIKFVRDQAQHDPHPLPQAESERGGPAYSSPSSASIETIPVPAAHQGTMNPAQAESLVRPFPGVSPMVHWIAFDDDTAEALVSRMRRGAAEIQHNTPVDAALHVEGASVMVLPSPTPGKLLLAHFSPRNNAHFQTAPPPRIPVRSVAGVPKSAPSQKKPWWRNIVA